MTIKAYILGFFSILLSSTYGVAQLEWSLPIMNADSGDVIAIELSVVGYTNIISAQGTIHFDEDVLEFTSADNFELASISGNSFGETQIDQGLLSFSWYESDLIGKNIADNSSVLTLNFIVIGDPGDYTSVELVNVPVVSEFVDASFTSLDFTHVSGSVSVNDGLSIGELLKNNYTVYPNPVLNFFKLEGNFNHDVQVLNWFGLNGDFVCSEKIIGGKKITRNIALKRGHYFIQVVDGEKVYKNRLIQLL